MPCEMPGCKADREQPLKLHSLRPEGEKIPLILQERMQIFFSILLSIFVPKIRREQQKYNLGLDQQQVHSHGDFKKHFS